MRIPPPPAAALLLLAACSADEPEPDPSAAEPAVTHPWDWKPDDPGLATGRAVYLAECALCHNEGEESAPELTDAAEWQARSEKTEEVLITHALEGFIGDHGEMPARGGTPSLTDAEVASAVRYMLATPKSESP